MKIKLLKNSLLVSAFFILSCSLFAQNSDSIPSNIIATMHLNTSSTTMVSYDYINDNWDTLFTVNDYNVGHVWFSTYDSYHRKYFYYRNNNSGTPSSTQTFYSLDINTQQIDSLFTVDNTPALDMLYDIYRNSLLVRVNDVILDYDLTNNSWDTLMTVPYSNVIYSPYAHYYDFVNQKYTYRNSSPTDSWVKTNLKKTLTDSVFADTMTNNLFPAGYVTFDYQSELYYGLANEKGIINKYIVSIGNNPNYTNVICSIPPDYYSHLSKCKACFDSERGLYILPYYSNSSINKYALIDINDSSLSTTSSSVSAANQHLDNFPNPIIKLEDSILISNWYSNYTWYYNGNVIPQSNSQTLQPLSTGWYKVSTVRPGNLIVFSDSIYVDFTNINNINEANDSILIYPNPAKNFFTVELFSQKNSIQNIDIKLWDISGRLISQLNRKDYSGKIIIPTENLNSGVYLVSISYNNNLIRKKLIISR
jgi:hypothetical protein